MKKGFIAAAMLVTAVAAVVFAQRYQVFSEMDGGSDSVPTVTVSDSDVEYVLNFVVSENNYNRLVANGDAEEISKYAVILTSELMQDDELYIYFKSEGSFDGTFTEDDYAEYEQRKIKMSIDEKITDSLSYKDYYLGVSSKCIVVVSGSTEAFTSAVEYLAEEYFSKDGKSLLSNYPSPGFHTADYVTGQTISGNDISDYTIVYDSTDDTATSLATQLQEYLEQECAAVLGLMSCSSDELPEEHLIIIGDCENYAVCANYYEDVGTFSYRVSEGGGNLYIMGGSEWALEYAFDNVVDNYFSQEDANVPKGYSYKGTVYGVELFDKYEGSNLRLMTQNVWGYEDKSPVWKEMGLDSSLEARIETFAGVFMAYSPDAICLQEMRSFDYIDDLLRIMKKKGYNYDVVDVDDTSQTPIIYNTDTLTLVECGYHLYTNVSSLSKSYTYAVFTLNETGEEFILFSTHLYEGSVREVINGVYRVNEMSTLNIKAESLLKEYDDAACFVLGDLNTYASLDDYQKMLDMGYDDGYAIATEYADDSCGLFSCNRITVSNKVKQWHYTQNARDHALVRNLGDSEVVSYDYVTPSFYGALSDHAALCLDVSLGG